MSFFGRPPWWQALHKTGLVLTVAGAVFSTAAVQAKGSPADAGATVSLAELPAEGRATYRLILSGGPFDSAKDGSVFGNRERMLPHQSRGFYREYTVRTPGAHDRGARRIVCGGHPPTHPEVCFYTGDHYSTFRRIVQ